MRVSVRFHRNDDLSRENMERIYGSCLTLRELETMKFLQGSRHLMYDTWDRASEVIARWEEQGYNIDEFESFMFSTTIS